MASRAQLVDEVIQPSLAAGRVVIADRFLLSTLVYQGVAGGLPVEDLWRIGQVATAGLLPDLTLVLDVPPDAASQRVGPARDRIEDRPADYQDAGARGLPRRGPTVFERRPALPLLSRAGDAGECRGRCRRGLRPDQERGGACPGTRSAGMTGSSRSLRVSLRSGRLPHALFFVGPEGMGKRTFARTLAKALLCEETLEEDLDPCGTCPACVQVEAGTHPDLLEAGRPAGAQRAAHPGHPRPLRRVRAQAGPGAAEGGDRR